MVGFAVDVRHGRYTIIRKIAEGGMAEIFLAKQHGSEGFEKLVVLKRILPAYYADQTFRNMLIDEAHISMGLTHANVAQILDVGKSGGRLFLVLELVDGWDLGKIFKRSEKAGTGFPPGLGVYVAGEVCRALSYAQAKCDMHGRPLGIVHRDVSPQNILVSEHGEVKLTDFGIAKVMTKREHTSAGIVKGKFAFMSPEQANGARVDARSDLYAVGILLYIVATGHRPYEAPTDIEVLLKVQSGKYSPPEQVDPRLSRSFAYVINKAMAGDPGRRYQSPDELLADIESLLRSEFGSVGGTALKIWLTGLGRRDGDLPIGRAPSKFVLAGTDSFEGKSVELGDDDGAGEIPLQAAAGAPGPPPMPVERRGERRPRYSATQRIVHSDLDLPIPDDGPGRATRSRPGADLALPEFGRPTRSRPSSDLALPDIGRPTRAAPASDLALSVDEPDFRGRSRRGLRPQRGGLSALGMLLILGLLGGGGYVVWNFVGRVAPSSPLSPDEHRLPAPGLTAATTRTTASASAPIIVPTAAPDARPSAAALPAASPQPEIRSNRKVERKPAVDPYARARAWQKQPQEQVPEALDLPKKVPEALDLPKLEPPFEKSPDEGTAATP